MEYKAHFMYLGEEYHFTLDTQKFDRNYDDENYAYWIVKKNGHYFEINVWKKDDCGELSNEGKVYAYKNQGDFEDSKNALEFSIVFNKEKRTIKVEVTIEYEYDPSHHDIMGFDISYIDAVAKDMVVRPEKNIQSGVRLISVFDKENEDYWLLPDSK